MHDIKLAILLGEPSQMWPPNAAMAAGRKAVLLLAWCRELSAEMCRAEGEWKPLARREHLLAMMGTKAKREGFCPVFHSKAICVAVKAVSEHWERSQVCGKPS